MVRAFSAWKIPKCLKIVRVWPLIALACLAAAQVQAQSPSPVLATPHEKDSRKILVDSAGQTFTLVGAGDIATCKYLDNARATAKLIEKIPGTVFAAGDLAYAAVNDFHRWAEAPMSTRTAMARPGGDSRTVPSLPSEIMNITFAPLRGISSIGASRLGQPGRDFIATI